MANKNYKYIMNIQMGLSVVYMAVSMVQNPERLIASVLYVAFGIVSLYKAFIMFKLIGNKKADLGKKDSLNAMIYLILLLGVAILCGALVMLPVDNLTIFGFLAGLFITECFGAIACKKAFGELF